MRRFLGVLSVLIVLTLIGCNRTGSTVASGPSNGNPQPPGPAAAGTITPANTTIEFVGTKKDGKHDGGFKSFAGTLSPPDGDFAASKITVEIDTDSLYSDNPKLTNHLKSPDFFEVKKYPKAMFVSTKIEPTTQGGATHLITGDLTLHGTTKPITFPVKVTQTDDLVILESTFTFNRLDYGIAYAPDRVDPIVTVKVSAKIPRK